jgi:hypothetical protein
VTVSLVTTVTALPMIYCLSITAPSSPAVRSSFLGPLNGGPFFLSANSSRILLHREGWRRAEGWSRSTFCDAGHIPNADHKVKTKPLAATPSPDTPGRLALEAYRARARGAAQPSKSPRPKDGASTSILPNSHEAGRSRAAVAASPSALERSTCIPCRSAIIKGCGGSWSPLMISDDAGRHLLSRKMKKPLRGAALAERRKLKGGGYFPRGVTADSP